MTEGAPSGQGGNRRPICRRCGSQHTRRSGPHNFWERALRSTGIRFHVCGDCGQRGWHVGRRSQKRPASAVPVSGRRSHPQQARRRRVLRTILFSLLLGGAAALWLQRCENRPRVEPSTVRESLENFVAHPFDRSS